MADEPIQVKTIQKDGNEINCQLFMESDKLKISTIIDEAEVDFTVFDDAKLVYENLNESYFDQVYELLLDVYLSKMG